jgi:nitrogen fixation protein NifQ
MNTAPPFVDDICAQVAAEQPSAATSGAVDPNRCQDGEPADALLFERMVGWAAHDATRPLTVALGLDRAELTKLIGRFLPHRASLLATIGADDGRGEDAVEEPDVRAYLLEFRAGRDEAEVWLAAILARRSREANHLWQDLGLAGRHELNTLLRRHYPELVQRNSGDMKWKKFLYRELCQRDGILVCKAPNCAVCIDFAHCFGGEPGEPLQTLSVLGHGNEQTDDRGDTDKA